MKRLVLIGTAGLLLIGTSGCSKADGLVKEQLKAMNALADALDRNATDDELRGLIRRLEENGKKLKQLREDDYNKAWAKNNAAFINVQKRMIPHSDRLSELMTGKPLGGVGVPGGSPPALPGGNLPGGLPRAPIPD